MSSSSSTNQVFVLDAKKQPLMSCYPARARELLDDGKAAVFRMHPFTIILKHRVGGQLQPLRLKFDPGAKTTGMALVATCKRGQRCVWAAELTHRSEQIKLALTKRRSLRRSRRHRHTRYRKPRFLNRRRKKGILPPSLQSRVDHIGAWTARLRRLAPITDLSMELARFDTQQLQNPEISGVEYQQGELMGYEVREYLLEKWGRRCAYCQKQDVALQIDHIDPKSKGGSNRVENLTLACERCNQKKGNQSLEEFLKRKPELCRRIRSQAKAPLKDAAAVNSTRFAMLEKLKSTELPVETGSGGLTKYNRSNQGYQKSHWLDAVCVGESGSEVCVGKSMFVLEIKAMGRGVRQMCGTDRYGFPIRHRARKKEYFGFQTGDLVVAKVPCGKKAGVYAGRVMVRATGSFDLSTSRGRIASISHRYCRKLHKADGYLYTSSLQTHSKHD